MDAIILCGGKGTRVKEITQDKIPKIMISINGRPFVDYLLNYLRHHRVKKVFFAAGYKGDVLNNYLRNIKFPVETYVEIESKPLLTGGAIVKILHTFGSKISDPFLVINGDTIAYPGEIDSFTKVYKAIKEQYERISEQWIKMKFPLVAIFTERLYQHGEYGNLEMNHRNLITNITPGITGRSWVNCGWYFFRKAFFTPYLNKDIFSLEDEALVDYFRKGNISVPVLIGWNNFIEIGTPDAIKNTTKLLQYKNWKELTL